jgi:hypothetical protein
VGARKSRATDGESPLRSAVEGSAPSPKTLPRHAGEAPIVGSRRAHARTGPWVRQRFGPRVGGPELPGRTTKQPVSTMRGGPGRRPYLLRAERLQRARPDARRDSIPATHEHCAWRAHRFVTNQVRPMAGQLAELVLGSVRHEAASDQSVSEEIGEPFSVLHMVCPN